MDTIVTRFDDIVQQFGDRLALDEEGYSLTYRELDQYSDQIAATLPPAQHGNHPIVGISLARMRDVVPAMLGILKTGRAYTFLDPSAPVPYKLAALRELGLEVIIGEAESGPWEGFEGLWIDRGELREPHSIRVPVVPSAPYTIVHTSGSTGRSLGVEISHAALLHTNRNYATWAKITPEDRFTVLTSPAHVGAYTATFGALLNGASIHPFAVKRRGLAAMTAWMEDRGLTIFQSTPTLFRAFGGQLSGSSLFPRLKLIRLGGEPVFDSDYALFQKHFSVNTSFVNAFGMSESGGNIAYFIVDRNQPPVSGVIPVGMPSTGQEVFIVDESGKSVPCGEIGEIVVSSKYLATGYYRNPELTARRFRSPGRTEHRELWTGDLGRITPEGWLMHCGRKDNQLKLRGQRVDLTELESIFRTIPQVETAVVLLEEKVETAAELVAFVVLASGSVHTASTIRDELSKRVPSHLVPNVIEITNQLPLNANGKIDRKKLLNSGRAFNGETLTEPRSPMENRVADLWRQVLGSEKVGLYDNFFASGGDSLKGLNLLVQLSDEFNVPLTPRDLIDRSTIAQMAEYLTSRQSQKGLARWKILFGRKRSEKIVPLKTSGGRRPLFIFPGGAAGEKELLIFASMAHHFPHDLPLYGLKQNFLLRTCYPARNVEIIARNYIQEIVCIQSEGPYYFLAECVASIVILEVARQLKASGQTVARLILLDPHCPDNWKGPESKKLPGKVRRYYRILSQAPLAPFDGPVHVLSSYSNDLLDQKLGGNPFSPGQLKWIRVPGNHESYIRQYREDAARQIARLVESD